MPNLGGSPPPPSLFANSYRVLEFLYAFPELEPWLFPFGVANARRLSFAVSQQPGSAEESKAVNFIQILWDCFRLGAPLCILFNQLRPTKLIEVSSEISPSTVLSTDSPQLLNSCKRQVYSFLKACREELGMSVEEQFTMTELYRDDITGFIKALKVISRVLEHIQQRNHMPSLRKLPFRAPPSSETNKPSDNRAKVVVELLETERAYVSALERLQKFKNELRDRNVFRTDVIQEVFVNLDDLLDFQRRFLIALEATLCLPYKEQRIGQVFLAHEFGFETYNEFCSNYKRACRIMIERTDELTTLKAKLNDYIEPKYEFSSYFIKPTQRICKYPLLLRELIKFSDERDYQFYGELVDGQKSIERVTEMVNESNRREENKVLKADLEERVEDWKGLNTADFGALQLSDRFQMTSDHGDREYLLYLFDRVLICCKEVKKKKKDAPVLTLKGNIYITSITGVSSGSKPEELQFALKVFWKDGMDLESFILKCRNEEQVRLWTEKIESIIESGKSSRRSISAARVSSVSSSARRSQIYIALNGWSTDGVDYDDDESMSEKDSGVGGVVYGARGSSMRARSNSIVSISDLSRGRSSERGQSSTSSSSHSRTRGISISPPPVPPMPAVPPLPHTPSAPSVPTILVPVAPERITISTNIPPVPSAISPSYHNSTSSSATSSARKLGHHFPPFSPVVPSSPMASENASAFLPPSAHKYIGRSLPPTPTPAAQPQHHAIQTPVQVQRKFSNDASQRSRDSPVGVEISRDESFDVIDAYTDSLPPATFRGDSSNGANGAGPLTPTATSSPHPSFSSERRLSTTSSSSVDSAKRVIIPRKRTVSIDGKALSQEQRNRLETSIMTGVSSPTVIPPLPGPPPSTPLPSVPSVPIPDLPFGVSPIGSRSPVPPLPLPVLTINTSVHQRKLSDVSNTPSTPMTGDILRICVQVDEVENVSLVSIAIARDSTAEAMMQRIERKLRICTSLEESDFPLKLSYIEPLGGMARDLTPNAWAELVKEDIDTLKVLIVKK